MTAGIGGKTIGGFGIGGKIVSALRGTLTWNQPAAGIELTRTLDRTFGAGGGATPASGGGNVEPTRFMQDGANWELWQVIPFNGSGISPPEVGDCRLHLRNRDESRGQNTLDEMPARIILKQDSWTDSPWEFTRPMLAQNSKFFNVGSGNSARKGIDYNPVRTPGTNAAAEGIAQGQEFTIILIWE